MPQNAPSAFMHCDQQNFRIASGVQVVVADGVRPLNAKDES